jgi:hypothetical protein
MPAASTSATSSIVVSSAAYTTASATATSSIVVSCPATSFFV